MYHKMYLSRGGSRDLRVRLVEQLASRVHLNLAEEAAELHLVGGRNLTRRFKEKQLVLHERSAELRERWRRADHRSHGADDSSAEAGGKRADREHGSVIEPTVSPSLDVRF